jgi:hypothetical protein
LFPSGEYIVIFGQMVMKPSLPVTAPGTIHPAAGVVVLARTLEDLGHDPAPALRRCGLPADLAGTGRTVPVDRELAFIREALALSGRPDLGLLAGRGHRFPVFGFWGLALVASPTLASAIRLGLQYVDLTHTFLRWSFHRSSGEAELVMRPAVPLGELERFFVERDAAAAATLFEDLTGRRGGLSAAEFAYPAPAWADRYAATFGCPVEFGRERHLLRLGAARLEDPLPGRDAVTAAAAEAQCRRLLDSLSPAGGLAMRLRRLLLDHPGRLPTQDEAARQLGLVATQPPAPARRGRHRVPCPARRSTLRPGGGLPAEHAAAAGRDRRAHGFQRRRQPVPRLPALDRRDPRQLAPQPGIRHPLNPYGHRTAITSQAFVPHAHNGARPP